MATIAAVRQQDAERLAAIAVDGVTLADAQKIIGEYLIQIVRCHVCGDTGRFTFARPATLKVAATNAAMVVKTGDETDCPLCGPPVNGRGAGDPAFVRWYCEREKDAVTCRAAKGAGASGVQEHAGCGLRVMLPVPLLEG